MPTSRNSAVFIVVCTVCALAVVGVGTEAACAVMGVREENGISKSFTHTVDTIIGALIALIITRKVQPPDFPIK